jgi:integrase
MENKRVDYDRINTEPITDKSKIEAMKTDLKNRNLRDYMLMLMQLNAGLRIGDTIKLKVSDVKDKDYLDIIEEKTSKTRKKTKKKHFKLNTQLKKEIKSYIKGMSDDDYLFPSRQVKTKTGEKECISRMQAYRILCQSAENVGIKNFSTHSLRKTFGWFYYKKTNDIAKLMDIFGHSSQKITLVYIGVRQAEIDATLDDFYL